MLPENTRKLPTHCRKIWAISCLRRRRRWLPAALTTQVHFCSALQESMRIPIGCMRLKARSRSCRITWKRRSENIAAAIDHLPANPVEGPLYGIQLHVDLMQLYRNLGDDNAVQQQLKIAQTQISALDERGADRAPFLRLRALIKMNSGDLDSALKDINEALSISPHDPNNLQLDGDLLVKLGRPQDAIAAYKQILAIDPRNRFALTSLGFVSRVVGREAEAKAYFERLAKDYPTLYIPYLAMGDMYTANHEFAKAEASYRKAFSLAPKKALIIAGGMNAAIEAQKLDLAGQWLERASNEMKQQPQVLKQRERYLRLQGHYQESVDVGQQAIKALPKDRDVVVYLGYDYLQLQQYSQLAKLTSEYYNIFPQDSDIPLLAGYVEKHDNNNDKALQDFTEAIRRNPKVATAYVNRGYIYNDLHKPDCGGSGLRNCHQTGTKQWPGAYGTRVLGPGSWQIESRHP